MYLAPLTDIYLLPGLDGTGKLIERFIQHRPEWANPIAISYEAVEVNSYEHLSGFVEAQVDSSQEHIILGESFSGPIAIRLASTNSESLMGVVLSASFATSPPLAHQIPVPGRLLEAAISVAPHRILAKMLLLNGVEDEALHDAVVAVTKTLPARKIAERLIAVQGVNTLKELEQLQCPMLYLRALHDHVVPSVAGDIIAATNRRSELIELDSPHMLLQSRPHEAWKAITQWKAKYS